MIARGDLNRIIEEVNKLLQRLEDRIVVLENKMQSAPKKPVKSDE
jgi:hypothetical protein